MDVSEHKELTNQILAGLADQATVSILLSQLVDANIQDESTIISQREQIAALKQDVEKYKQMNTELFLKIGAAAEPAAAEEKDDVDPQKPSIESLFDENGFLK